MSETIDVSDEQDDGRDHSFEEANLDKPAAIRRPVRRQPDRSGGDHREGRRHLRADRELLLLHHHVIKQIGKRPSAISSCRTKAGQQQRRCFLMAGKRCALKEDHRTTSGCFACLQERTWRRNGGPHPRCGVEGVCSAIFPFSAGPHTSVCISQRQLWSLGVPVY